MDVKSEQQNEWKELRLWNGDTALAREFVILGTGPDYRPLPTQYRQGLSELWSWFLTGLVRFTWFASTKLFRISSPK